VLEKEANSGVVFFVGYLTTLIQYQDYIALDGRMTDELKSTWKEAVVVHWRYCPGIYLEELRKTTKIYQKTWCHGLDSNRVPPKYRSRALSLDQLVSFLEATNLFSWDTYDICHVLCSAATLSCGL
jgi:hypothetical protein